MEEIDNHILKLISAYTTKEIDEAGFKELKNWVEASSKNKKQFLDYLKFYKKSRQISFTSSVSEEEAWNLISAKLIFCSEKDSNTTKKSKVIRLHKNWFKYAVAVVFVGVIFSTYFFNSENSGFTPLEPESNSTNIIVSGSNKAKLTLENGTDVVLEKGVSYKNKHIKSNGENIVYQDDKLIKSNKIAYNYLTVPRGGQFSLKLSDGSQVWLNSASKLKYPVQFLKGKPREVELIYGEAYFSVTPIEKNNGDSFSVIHKKQNINVLGTEFNVKAYQEEANVYTTLVEGKVALSYKEGNNQQLLAPNEQSVYNTASNSLTISKVAIFNEISWRKGIFSFNDKPLEEIMKVLSRWYNVDVIFENEEIKKSKFVGVLTKNQNMEEILSIIENFGVIKEYQIKNNKIILK